MSEQSILVVDDDENIRKLLSAYLRRRGYTVTLAKDGMEALQLLDGITPTLVVTDLNMPRMDGNEFIRHLRGNPATAGIPIMVISAQSQDGAAKMANVYLAKPLELTALLLQIRTLLENVR